MREYLSLQEVYDALPAEGPGLDCLQLEPVLKARGGNIFNALEQLFNAGCAGRNDRFSYYRIAGADVPDAKVSAWMTGGADTKRSDAVGNIGTEGGGASAHRSPPPLKLFGEDPNRPRVPLELVRKRNAATEALAKSYVAADIARSNDAEVLSAAADAHEFAAEMLRARVKRLSPRAPSAASRSSSAGTVPAEALAATAAE